MRTAHLLTCGVLTCALAVPQARAQEQAQDERPMERARVGLLASGDLQERKIARAREGRWAWTLLGMVDVGYDSNIFKSPSSGLIPALSPGKENALAYDVGLKVAVLRYFNDRDRLSLSLAATGSPNLEESKITEYTQKFRARYSARFSNRLRFSVSGTVQHENDDEADAFGGSLSRDLENFAYKVSPSLRYKLSKRQSVRLSFPVKLKDYEETTLVNSLDYREYGPRLKYRGRWSTSFVELSYAFAVRSYDDELASLADGSTVATNPEEEHRYHKIGIELGWRLSDNFELFGGYRFRSKDDRFEGFESYDDHSWQIGFAATPARAWSIRAKVSYGKREYDNRHGDLPTEELEYDKLGGSLMTVYRMSKHLSLFTRYSYSKRDSNRSTGTSYLDYEVHRFFMGLSFGY